jgi:hypothetical protein
MNDMNIPLLRKDLAEAATRSRQLKRLLGQRWERPMADEQRELARLRRHTTELCVLRAHLRGRSHLHDAPSWWSGTWERDRCLAEIAERAAIVYRLREAG